MNGTGLQAWRRDEGALRQLRQEKGPAGFSGLEVVFGGCGGSFPPRLLCGLFPLWPFRNDRSLAIEIRDGACSKIEKGAEPGQHDQIHGNNVCDRRFLNYQQLIPSGEYRCARKLSQ
jgi:hypothetical protein